jgi:hypothetical protein
LIIATSSRRENSGADVIAASSKRLMRRPYFWPSAFAVATSFCSSCLRGTAPLPLTNRFVALPWNEPPSAVRRACPFDCWPLCDGVRLVSSV